MTDKAFEDILVWDKPKFDLFTWCSDAHGQVPAQVHLVMEIAEGVRVMVRFAGPNVIDDLILALTRHRNDVWPLDDIPMRTTFSQMYEVEE